MSTWIVGQPAYAWRPQHFGRNYSLDYLRQRCYTTRDGVSMMSISDTLEQIGFKTIGGRILPDKLLFQAPLPCILHWNSGHFVVLYRVSGSREKPILHIADPSKGGLKLSLQEFNAAWLSTQSQGEERGAPAAGTHPFYEMAHAPGASNGSSLRFLGQYFKRYLPEALCAAAGACCWKRGAADTPVSNPSRCG